MKPANASDVEDEEFSGNDYDQEDDADSDDDEYVQGNKGKNLKGAGGGRGGRTSKSRDYEPPSKRVKYSHQGQKSRFNANRQPGDAHYDVE